MVEEIKQIIARFPKQHKTDLEILIAHARQHPEEDIVFLMLQNYPPDLFNSDLWAKSDSLSKQFKSISQQSKNEMAFVSEEDNLNIEVSPSEQNAIIEAFLKLKLPDFI